MRWIGEMGFTLIELLVTLTIMGIIVMAAMPLLSTVLDANTEGTARSKLYEEGLLAMERMTSGARRCTFLLIPNSHKTSRDILAFSGQINDDDDYYFNDPLFPRIDEEAGSDMNLDSQAGIAGIDDDGDGNTDESLAGISDDDEDDLGDEEVLDGLDDDGDGTIDEDLSVDLNKDSLPGIGKMDDDGDGAVDDGGSAMAGDNDEDGQIGEDPANETLYLYNSGTKTLTEAIPSTGKSTVLSTHVTAFQATYQAPDAAHGPRIQIALTLTGDNSESVPFVESVYPRNVLQKTGKRVR